MARFTLPELPYAIDALAPAISRELLVLDDPAGRR